MQITEIANKKDLTELEERIISNIKILLEDNFFRRKKWLRSTDVCEMMNISHSSLKNFRENGTIPFTRLGGTFFYDYEKIMEILENNEGTKRGE